MMIEIDCVVYILYLIFEQRFSPWKSWIVQVRSLDLSYNKYYAPLQKIQIFGTMRVRIISNAPVYIHIEHVKCRVVALVKT